MKSPRKLLWALVTSMLLCPPAFAWSSAGHMTIAAGAYRQLSRKVKTKVADMLKAHPDYAKWMAAFARERSGVDEATFIFMHASTWPDEIRRRGSPYDHPQWHYVDYPLQPPAFPIEPEPAPDNDALYGIAQSEKALADPDSSPELRAVYLSWLLHLVGDLHQPLHCASLVNQTYPRGDKGGNEFYVRPASRGISLHTFWDDLLGTSARPSSRLKYAIRIMADHPKRKLPELKQATTSKAWSLDSRLLAVEKAYLSGHLNGTTNPNSAPALPEGYARQAKAVAERQAALAAYRLADEIQRVLR